MVKGHRIVTLVFRLWVYELVIVSRASVLRAVPCVATAVNMVCPLRPVLPAALGPTSTSTVSTHAAYCHVILTAQGHA